MIKLQKHEAAMLSNDEFKPAFIRLSRLVIAENAIKLYREFTDYLKAIGEGRTYEPSSAFAAALIVTLLHVTMGTPLHFSDELMERWNAIGTEHLGECIRCGYRVPDGPCAVCGGRTGQPGCWSKARARVALSN